MGKYSIPDRWLPYTPVGKQIEGTKFLAFKVPLNDMICRQVEPDERFSPADLVENHPKLQLIIDLTNTTRYYNKMDFLTKGIDYAKIFCPGKITPPKDVVKKFFDVVDKFISLSKPEDAVIGVHCTHGVNRTGYLICKYMIMRLGIEPNDAITRFKEARGHEIEREPYLKDLLSTEPKSSIDFKTEICYEESSKIDADQIGRSKHRHEDRRRTRSPDRRSDSSRKSHYKDDHRRNNDQRRDGYHKRRNHNDNESSDPFYRNQSYGSSSSQSYNYQQSPPQDNNRLGRVSQLNYYEEDNSNRYSRFRGRGGRGSYSSRPPHQSNHSREDRSQNSNRTWGDLSSNKRSFSHERSKRKNDHHQSKRKTDRE